MIGNSEININLSSSFKYVEFDAHKGGGRGSENAFYVKAETPVESIHTETTQANTTVVETAAVETIQVEAIKAEVTAVDSALVEVSIEDQVYGEHASTPPAMVKNTSEIRLDFNNLNLSEGDHITLQVAENYQVQGVVEADGLDVLLTSLGKQIIDEGGLFSEASLNSGQLTLTGFSDGSDMPTIEVTLEAPLHNDLIHAGAGNDKVYGGLGDDKLYGGEGDDELYGSGQYDKLFGEGGDDRLYGGSHDNELNGGDGADRLNGEGGDDILRGDKGNDTLYGVRGADSLYGGFADDRLYGGEGNDVLYDVIGDDCSGQVILATVLYSAQ